MFQKKLKRLMKDNERVMSSSHLEPTSMSSNSGRTRKDAKEDNAMMLVIKKLTVLCFWSVVSTTAFYLAYPWLWTAGFATDRVINIFALMLSFKVGCGHVCEMMDETACTVLWERLQAGVWEVRELLRVLLQDGSRGRR